MSVLREVYQSVLVILYPCGRHYSYPPRSISCLLPSTWGIMTPEPLEVKGGHLNSLRKWNVSRNDVYHFQAKACTSQCSTLQRALAQLRQTPAHCVKSVLGGNGGASLTGALDWQLDGGKCSSVPTGHGAWVISGMCRLSKLMFGGHFSLPHHSFRQSWHYPLQHLNSLRKPSLISLSEVCLW